MAVEQADAKFQSKLDEASMKRAKEELGEKNDKDRAIAVQSFREWVLQQKWLKTPTDFEFLLRFVRARKFSLLLARQTLENYWTCKTKTPEWFQNIDPADKTIQEILKTGFYCVSKKLDKDGRRIIFEKAGLLDMNKVKKTWGVENVFKTIVLVCEWGNRDENMQVNGLYVFVDMTDMTLSHATTLWNTDNGKRMMQYYQTYQKVYSYRNTYRKVEILTNNSVRDAVIGQDRHLLKSVEGRFSHDAGHMIFCCISDGKIGYKTPGGFLFPVFPCMKRGLQNSLPCRMKGLHMYNEPAFFDGIFAIMKPLMKQKTKDRMHLHGRNMTHVYKDIDMSVLPDEYLPDDYEGPRIGTWQQIVDEMIEDMMKPEFREYIKEISSPKYGVDLSLKPGAADTVGSFRKLNVD